MYLCNITIHGSGTATGAGSYPENSQVTLVATPDSGYVFRGWYKVEQNTYASTDTFTGSDNYSTISYTLLSEESTYSFIIEEDITIDALFEVPVLNSYTITVSASPYTGGTATISGTTDSQGKFIEGTEVTIRATALGDYQFNYWAASSGESGGIFTEEAEYTFIASQDLELIATFSKIVHYYTLKVKSNQPTYGRVSVTGAILVNAQDEEGYAVYTMTEDNQVQLYAVANTGYSFVEWSNGVTSASYVFIAARDVTMSATFDVTPLIPVEATIVSLDSTSTELDSVLSGTILLENPSEYNYVFYWDSLYTSESTIWIPSLLTDTTFELPIDDVFENLLISNTRGTFYLKVTAVSTTQSLFQQGIQFTIDVPNTYHPTITLENITVGKDFNDKVIAGYSTFRTAYTTGKTPANNSATITNVSAYANIGYCNIFYPNTIIGNFASSKTDYEFVITATARDTRNRTGTSTTNTVSVLGYSTPVITVSGIERCNEEGEVSDNPEDNVYCKLTYTIDFTQIEGNRINIRDLTFAVGDQSYTALTILEDNVYTSILGGDLDPAQNYIINVGVVDSIMKELDIPRVITSEVLSGKLALSLLDNLRGGVGMAVGVEATLENVIDLALDTYFRNNVKLQANTHIEGDNREASIDSYDLVHNSVRVYEDDNTETGTYGNIIRCMTGEEYTRLRDNEETDKHTLYFLSTPTED